MPLNFLNSSNLEQPALKGLTSTCATDGVNHAARRVTKRRKQTIKQKLKLHSFRFAVDYIYGELIVQQIHDDPQQSDNNSPQIHN